MSDGTPEEREKEIQEILSDLDSILKSATGASPSKEAAASPPPPAPEKKAPPPPPEPEVKIELPKVEEPKGLQLPPIAPQAPAPSEPPAKKEEPKPVEVELGARSLPPQPKEPEKPPQPKTPAPAAVPAAVPPAPAAKAPPPAAKPSPAIGGVKGGEPPAEVPKEQVRRIAFMYAPGRKDDFESFSAFVSEVALKVSKKPIYIHKAFVLELTPGSDPAAVLQRVKEAGAVGCLALLAGLKDSFVRDVEDAFSAQDFFLRVVAMEDAAKRAAAIDLVVDMMLLKAG